LWRRVFIIAAFFDVTERTIDNYIEKYGEELRQNGYEMLRGKRLKELKLKITPDGVNETDFVNTKAPNIGIFDFRVFLNLSMLIVGSERAVQRFSNSTTLHILKFGRRCLPNPGMRM